MNRVSLLDCTLRDGGYITDWNFENSVIRDIIHNLAKARLDYIEVGYLNSNVHDENRSIFDSIEKITDFLPQCREEANMLAMADVTQFSTEKITPYTGRSVDGIRVVFYKHQVKEALEFCKAVSAQGYKLFVQPMVTIDYTPKEYGELSEEIAKLDPYSVAIVDSFGYMNKKDVSMYFQLLDGSLPQDVSIGFHSHNNMQLAFITAQDILEYETQRNLIIDASLYGMGRGAGNLNTELITNYYNIKFGNKYDVDIVLDLISDHIMPIRKQREWGYSPYMLLTGINQCHPNFAAYLLENHDVSVSEFRCFVKTIPEDMKTKCRKPYVEELFKRFKNSGQA